MPTTPPTPTDAERERAGRATARYLSAEQPDLSRVIADALAAQRAELPAVDTDRVARLLARYDAATEEWTKANAEQDSAPSVQDSTRYSERLEELAHAFASFARDLIESAPTIPPADPRRAELTALEAEFEAAGGRGPELADRIDALRVELGDVDPAELAGEWDTDEDAEPLPSGAGISQPDA